MSAINTPPLTKGLAQASRDRNSAKSLWGADAIRRTRIGLRVFTVFLLDPKSGVRMDDMLSIFTSPLILNRKRLNDFSRLRGQFIRKQRVGSSPHVGWEDLNSAPGTSERWFWVKKQ